MTRRLVIIGSGIAGLYAALLAAEAPGVEAVLLTKGTLGDGNTGYAQGGISAVLGPGEASTGDSVSAHIADTLAAGAGLSDPEAVRVLCTEAVRDIAGLRRFGVEFDAAATGGPALGLEAAHSAARILHAGGDATGARISSALGAAVLEQAARGRLRVLTGAFATALLNGPDAGGQDAGAVTGVAYLAGGRRHRLDADAVLLATGGAGRMFSRTTNPRVATADGLALAWRAGAAVRDLEFYQFHPTTLATADTPDGPPALLVSEAVRGEGAVLRDAAGRRFLPDYHPDAELAPRDVVSRSIALHLAATGADAGTAVHLDARGIEAARGAGYLARRFPTISAGTRAAGYDWTEETVPVSPAAHYWMGGVATNLAGRTTVPGLYAAGEVACTGVHGANRLASNSLLEGLVFGRRAVEDFLGAEQSHHSTAPRAPHDRPNLASSVREPGSCGPTAAGGLALTHASAALSRDAESGGTTPAFPEGCIETWPGAFSRGALGRLMTRAAGVSRTGAGLDAAAARLTAWASDLRPETVSESADRAGHEDRNLLLAATLLVEAARRRTGSVGAHFRADPEAAAAVPRTPEPRSLHLPQPAHGPRHATRSKQRITS
ncbi:FAD-binding protein [Arthrobacter sp. NPDC080082]|uniref:L-aspartate oxidase n=1 Tax=unclassified Arthrobacter TaxID=235627 RepID=UPI0034440F25